MLIEHISGQVEQIQKGMESMMNNGVNIKRLQEDVKMLREDVEKLKDRNRDIIYKMEQDNKSSILAFIIAIAFDIMFVSI